MFFMFPVELLLFVVVPTGALTKQVVTNKIFLKDPHAAADAAWIKSNKGNAANGG